MSTRLKPVAFDIETTGFETDHEVTVMGLVVPLGCRVLLQTNNRECPRNPLEGRLETTFETPIRLSTHPTERAMLEAFSTFVADAVAPEEYMLVAYNGERFRGGFDLPFLRTRYGSLGIEWPFDDVPYADLMPIFQHRFNTTVDGSDRSDLEGVYQAMVAGDLTDKDPFETSEEAVTAFNEGRFEPLLTHNIADILRTDRLASVAQKYCGKSDFNLKSLTPTNRDPQLQETNHPQ